MNRNWLSDENRFGFFFTEKFDIHNFSSSDSQKLKPKANHTQIATKIKLLAPKGTKTCVQK